MDPGQELYLVGSYPRMLFGGMPPDDAAHCDTVQSVDYWAEDKDSYPAFSCPEKSSRIAEYQVNLATDWICPAFELL